MQSHSTFTGRQIGRNVLASLSVIVFLAASVSAQSVLGTTGKPLAGGTAAVAGKGSPAPNATAGNWKTYKHPVGLSLRYPGDWTLQEVPGFIQLISPEVQKSAQGQPTELYIVSAEQAGRTPRVGMFREAWIGDSAAECERVWAPHALAVHRLYYNVGVYRRRFEPWV